MSFINSLTGLHVLGVWSLNVNSGIANGVNPTAYARGVDAAIVSLHGTITGSAAGINPQVTVAPVSGRDRSVITCAVNFDVLGGAPMGGRELNLAIATAFKNAGAGSTLSAQRIADGFSDDSNIGEVFSINPAIARCSADFRTSSLSNAPPQGVVGVDSPFGSTLARSGTAPITRSNDPALVGQRLPAVGGTVFDNLGGLLSSIPMGYKIAGTVALVVGGGVATAYVVRSFK